MAVISAVKTVDVNLFLCLKNTPIIRIERWRLKSHCLRLLVSHFGHLIPSGEISLYIHLVVGNLVGSRANLAWVAKRKDLAGYWTILSTKKLFKIIHQMTSSFFLVIFLRRSGTDELRRAWKVEVVAYFSTSVWRNWEEPQKPSNGIVEIRNLSHSNTKQHCKPLEPTARR
jgi:hypothetical protein